MRQSRLKYFGPEVTRVFAGADVRFLDYSASYESSFAVTHVIHRQGLQDCVLPIARERSYLIEVFLQPAESSDWGVWAGGFFKRSHACEVGAVEIHDLELEPRFQRSTGFESLLLTVPKKTFDAYSDDSGLASVRSFRSSRGAKDLVMLHLARLMSSYMEDQIEPSDTFLRHFIKMICGHVIAEYGSLAESQRVSRGGLAPWQKRRALEILDSDLDGDLRLARLAAECGLSSSYFCRCFRVTFGSSVHQFVVKRRIERAQQLLLEQQLQLADIAMATGFSDQAAFSRTFASVIGMPPGKWRNRQRTLGQRVAGADGESSRMTPGSPERKFFGEQRPLLTSEEGQKEIPSTPPARRTAVENQFVCYR